MSYPRIYRLLVKDLKVAFRGWSDLLSASSFVVLASLVIASGRGGPQIDLYEVLPGISVIMLFASIFSSYISVVSEKERGTLYYLMTAPITPLEFFLEKLAFTMILVGALSLQVVAVFFLVGGPQYSLLIPIASLASYLAVASTISSIISIFLLSAPVLNAIISTVLASPILISYNNVALISEAHMKIASATTVLVAIAFTSISIVIANQLLASEES